jgi:hypothetical protein
MALRTECYTVSNVIRQIRVILPGFNMMGMQVGCGPAMLASTLVTSSYFIAPPLVTPSASLGGRQCGLLLARGKITAFCAAIFSQFPLALFEWIATALTGENGGRVVDGGAFGRACDDTFCGRRKEGVPADGACFSSARVANEMPRMPNSKGLATGLALANQAVTSRGVVCGAPVNMATAGSALWLYHRSASRMGALLTSLHNCIIAQLQRLADMGLTPRLVGGG